MHGDVYYEHNEISRKATSLEIFEYNRQQASRFNKRWVPPKVYSRDHEGRSVLYYVLKAHCDNFHKAEAAHAQTNSANTAKSVKAKGNDIFSISKDFKRRREWVIVFVRHITRNPPLVGDNASSEDLHEYLTTAMALGIVEQEALEHTQHEQIHITSPRNEVDSAEKQSQTQRIFINMADKNGHTPLYWATELDSIDFLNLFLEFGANPNLSNAADGETVMHLAVRKDRWDIFDGLITRNNLVRDEMFDFAEDIVPVLCDWRIRDKQGMDVLFACINYGRVCCLDGHLCVVV